MLTIGLCTSGETLTQRQPKRKEVKKKWQRKEIARIG